MKAFASIIAVFFLCLSVLPCADKNDSHSEITVSSEAHNHEHAADDCAPFCYCNCCHVHATIQIEGQVFSEISQTFKPVSNYRDYIPHLLAESLFRPPILYAIA
ncbi:MAG: hypothetical protein DWP98_02705 [Bacteroidetes bacterium]|nr:MAG: hypothetical protein DWP98_02705 [Bacteroidota bacterium]MBL1144341.1 hypothetical protein [Bacteroidota bacterium]NOG57137.1 hypothetical protein [Bacteroidota bacterium]